MNGVKPTKHPEYLQEFALDDTTKIFFSPEIARCVLGASHSHKFLEGDGYNQCVNFQNAVWSTCYIKEEQAIYCLLYFAEHSVVPKVGDNGVMSVSLMRENALHVDELTLEEVKVSMRKERLQQHYSMNYWGG